MKKILTRISRFLAVGLTAGALVGGVALVALPSTNANAVTNTALCDGVNTAGEGSSADGCSGPGYEEAGQESAVDALIKNILNIFSYVVGAISVIMIIVGGFRYITSGGDQAGVSGAKNTILYAIVGLVIVIFAQVIVKFVISRVSTTN